MTAPQEPNSPSDLFTPFLPSTYNVPQEEDRLDVFLTDKLSVFADVINQKKIGQYVQDAENFNGENWFYDTTKKNRNGYQAIARITSFVSGAIPMPIPNVNPEFIITHVWGSASLPCSATGAGDGDYFSFMAAGDPRISFTMSDTTITITATAPMSAYNGFIVVEYLRAGV